MLGRQIVFGGNEITAIASQKVNLLPSLWDVHTKPNLNLLIVHEGKEKVSQPQSTTLCFDCTRADRQYVTMA